MSQLFTALVTFYSPETNSTYIEGLGYTVRPGNHVLAELVKGWLSEGKVSLGGPESRIEGKE
jgi:hypothetical protein